MQVTSSERLGQLYTDVIRVHAAEKSKPSYQREQEKTAQSFGKELYTRQQKEPTPEKQIAATAKNFSTESVAEMM